MNSRSVTGGFGAAFTMCEFIGHFAVPRGCSSNDKALGEMATRKLSTKVSVL